MVKTAIAAVVVVAEALCLIDRKIDRYIYILVVLGVRRRWVCCLFPGSCWIYCWRCCCSFVVANATAVASMARVIDAMTIAAFRNCAHVCQGSYSDLSCMVVLWILVRATANIAHVFVYAPTQQQLNNVIFLLDGVLNGSPIIDCYSLATKFSWIGGLGFRACLRFRFYGSGSKYGEVWASPIKMMLNLLARWANVNKTENRLNS